MWSHVLPLLVCLPLLFPALLYVPSCGCASIQGPPIIEKHTNAIRYNEEGQVRAGAAQRRSSSTCHRIIAQPQHQQVSKVSHQHIHERACPQYCE